LVCAEQQCKTVGQRTGVRECAAILYGTGRTGKVVEGGSKPSTATSHVKRRRAFANYGRRDPSRRAADRGRGRRPAYDEDKEMQLTRSAGPDTSYWGAESARDMLSSSLEESVVVSHAPACRTIRRAPRHWDEDKRPEKDCRGVCRAAGGRVRARGDALGEGAPRCSNPVGRARLSVARTDGSGRSRASFKRRDVRGGPPRAG